MTKTKAPKAPAEIVLHETALADADYDMVAAFVAAKRAATQAAAVIKKLEGPVLKLAKQHPDLLIDGARITASQRKGWTYSAVIAGLSAHLTAAKKTEEEDGKAVGHLTEFPVVKELEKFTGQAVTGIKTSLWKKIFS